MKHPNAAYQWTIQVHLGQDITQLSFNGSDSALRCKQAEQRLVRRMALAKGQIDRIYIWEKDVLVRNITPGQAIQLHRPSASFAETGQVTKVPPRPFGEHFQRKELPSRPISSKELGLGLASLTGTDPWLEGMKNRE